MSKIKCGPMDAAQPERIVLARRLARLWREHMAVPEFDQLGEDRASYSSAEQAREQFVRTMHMKICEDTTPKQLDVFEAELVRILTEEYPLREWAAGLPADDHRRDWAHNLGQVDDFYTDYHPDEGLSAAIAKAGLPEQQLPIKSSGQILINGSGLRVAFGYAAPIRYHYPLDDGRWLVTSLAGDPSEIRQLQELLLWADCNGMEHGFELDGNPVGSPHVLILACSYRSAAQLAKRERLSFTGGYTLVTGPADVRGHSPEGARIVTAPGWREHRDAEAIEQALALAGFEVPE